MDPNKQWKENSFLKANDYLCMQFGIHGIDAANSLKQ